MKNKNILISGAGIAGLTVAFWLKKYGFNPAIVEKHHTLRTDGYKLDIRGSALDVIKKMGLFQEVFENRTQIQKALFVDKQGKILKETSADLCGVREKEDLEIVRGDLCNLLLKQIGEINCLFDDSILNIKEQPDGLLVEFEKSKPQLFDLVIGADGLHSKVRKITFVEENLFLKQFGIYASFFSIPNFLDLDRVEIEYHNSKKFAVVYCPQNGFAKAGFAFSSKVSITDLKTTTMQKELIYKTFCNEGWKIPNLLEYMNQSKEFYFDCMAQVHMPHWTKDRVALVGDAGYAVSPLAGQGTSVALVGAYVLAGELAEVDGNYKQAFAIYEKTVKKFVEKNQKLAQMSADLMQENTKTWFKAILMTCIYTLTNLLPAYWIQYLKNVGLKRTTLAANSIKLKNYRV